MRVHQHYSSIGSDDSLVFSKQHDIIWRNDGQYADTRASLDLDEFKNNVR